MLTGLFSSLWIRFTFDLGLYCFWVSLWSLLQQVFIFNPFFIIIIYCVSFVSTLQMRSQTGNVRSLFPTGAMIFLLHQRQILFYKSPSKRLWTLHSNGTSAATLERGVVIHSVSVPSNVVKRCQVFWLIANMAAALKWSRRVEIPNVLGGVKARRLLFTSQLGKGPLPKNERLRTRPSWAGSILPAGNHGRSTVAAEEATWKDGSAFSKRIAHESVSLRCHFAWMLTGGA